MVHMTDMKKIALMEHVADEYERLGKEGRFSKKCIPRGYIPDFDWTTIHLQGSSTRNLVEVLVGSPLVFLLSVFNFWGML